MRFKTNLQKERADKLEKDFERFEIKDETIKGSYFKFLSANFDLERANYLAQWHSSSDIPYADFLKLYGGLIHIDKKKALALPDKALESPLYIATMFMGSMNEPLGILFDGWHRCVKAESQGLKELPVIVFTPIETMWIMHELNIYVEA